MINTSCQTVSLWNVSGPFLPVRCHVWDLVTRQCYCTPKQDASKWQKHEPTDHFFPRYETSQDTVSSPIRLGCYFIYVLLWRQIICNNNAEIFKLLYSVFLSHLWYLQLSGHADVLWKLISIYSLDSSMSEKKLKQTRRDQKNKKTKTGKQKPSSRLYSSSVQQVFI